ncbi:MAG TPA: hypothetical protein VF228_21130 [Iamia sp.]
MPTLIRILGALAGLAGMVAFTCHFAVPVDLGSGSITVSEATATYRNAGVAVHLLLLAALGLAAAVRPEIGARVLALGGLGLPWLAGRVDQLWEDGVPGPLRVFAGAVLLGLVVVGGAGVLGVREVRWSAGGVLLGDGLAVLVAAAVLWGLLGVNWYRVRDLTSDALFEPRFGSLLDPATGGGQATWIAAALAGLALVVAVAGGGWGRRVAGVVVGGVCAFEALRRVFLSGDRLIPPAEQANPFGAQLSGEPVLGVLVLPLVGLAAGAWFLTTEGERPVDEDDEDDQRLAARNPSASAASGSE